MVYKDSISIMRTLYFHLRGMSRNAMYLNVYTLANLKDSVSPKYTRNISDKKKHRKGKTSDSGEDRIKYLWITSPSLYQLSYLAKCLGKNYVC